MEERIYVGFADDAERYGNALNVAGWAFIEAAPEGSIQGDLWNNLKSCLRSAILKYASLASSDTDAYIRELLAENAALKADADRYRWLRGQHEAQEVHSDTEGFSWTEPAACSFTVFCPTQDECLEPVACLPGELDAAIDEAMRK